jgi:hypothetical protein
MQRALGQQVAAEKTINARMALAEKPLERRVQHTTEHTQQNVDNKTKYSNFCID